MTTKFYKLFDLLKRKNMKKTDLLPVISSSTLAKLTKAENVNTESICKICELLHCQPNDIMEVCTEVETEDDKIAYIVEETGYTITPSFTYIETLKKVLYVRNSDFSLCYSKILEDEVI